MSRSFSRWLPVAAVVVVLTALWFTATLSAPDVTRLPMPAFSPKPPATAAPPTDLPTALPENTGADDRGWQPPDWILTAAAGLCVLVTLAVAGLLVWYLLTNTQLRRKPRLFVEEDEAKPLVPPPDEIIAAVEAGLDRLSEVGTDPRAVVIACWVRLEAAAAGAGTPRHIGDSPTDLVVRLLHAHQISRAALDGLARVYREARYATHPVDENARLAAVGALRQLRTELGVLHGRG